MKTPRFWYLHRPGALARALQPFGALYGAVAARRMARTGARMNAPVVTTGNFVAGGAGKTPTAIAIARLLMAMGERPAFISRGAGGRGGPPARVEGQPAAEVGDEPILLARVAPTFVGADRIATCALALKDAAPSVLILDDGLQSRRVEPDLAIAVVDGATGIGNGLCLPAGPLRAPLAGQLADVAAVVVVGQGAASEEVAHRAQAAGAQLLRAHLAPDASASALAGRKVVAFAGIGLPEKFFATLQSLGADIVARRAFADHHGYAGAEIADLRALASRHGAMLATTEKDAVRLPPGAIEQDLLAVVPVRLAFADESAVSALLASALARARGG